MRFADKIVWSSFLITAVVFSAGSTYMISRNHSSLLNEIIQQSIQTHEKETFSLESKLLQDSVTYQQTESGYNEAYMRKRAIYYLDQMLTYNTNAKESYALVGSDKKMIFHKIDDDILQSFHYQSTSEYRINEHEKKQYMMISSLIKAGNISYYFISSHDLSSCYQERNRQYRDFLITNLIILLIVYITNHVLARYLTRPIHTLNQISQRIAAGRYSERTKLSSNDEIGELSKSFDGMAAAVEQKVHQLEQQAEQREEFMGSFAHEIKTPMTAILGYADMLRSMDYDQHTRRKAANYIYTEGRRLETLSYTLMDLLALSQQEVILQKVSVIAISKQLQVYYEGCGSHHQLQLHCDDALVLANEELLFTLLRNVIDNALKASSPTQIVLLKGVHYQQCYQFSIIDEGIGMSKEDLKKVVNPFYMADKSRSRSNGGAGLGLSIVSRICDIHHTKLHIDSELGQGTTVSFMLEVVDK